MGVRAISIMSPENFVGAHSVRPRRFNHLAGKFCRGALWASVPFNRAAGHIESLKHRLQSRNIDTNHSQCYNIMREHCIKRQGGSILSLRNGGMPHEHNGITDFDLSRDRYS